MLTCQELTELVTDYLEGRLNLGERLRFRMHIAMCSDCRRYLDQMEQTVAATGALGDAEIPPEIQDHLLVAFRDWRQER